jgi:Recombinase
MANKTSLQAVQNAFLKRLIWKRYRNRIPENKQTTILLDQFVLRIKIDSRKQGFNSDQAIDIAKPYIAKWAPWYDVESFPWKSRDKIKLLRAEALGEAIALTEREWFQCKPIRGGAAITPIDKGKDRQVQEWIKTAQRKSAEKRNEKLKNKRKAVRKILQTEVRRLLKQGLSYEGLAKQFQDEHRAHPSAKGIHIWTERQVFAFDPDRKKPEHKRKFEAERKRMKRHAMTGREQKAAQIEEARRSIYALHFEGEGHASIARILNERKIPSRRGSKWHKKSVKRELAEGDKGGQKCPVSMTDYTKGNMVRERADRLSQAVAAETLQEEGMLSISIEDRGQVLPRSRNSEWFTPALIEMPYTNALRQLYREKVPEAA